jgi:hypothetical protein
LVVPDAAAVPLVQVLDEARKTLGQDGIIVVGSRPAGSAAPLEATRAGDGPDYGTLEQELGDRFDYVTMVGRGPFVGYLYARIEAEDAEVTLDTRLVPDDVAAAEAFIAVAGDHPIDLDSLALVQIPPAELLAAARAPAVDTRGFEEEVAKREGKIKDLEKSAAERWVQVQKLENELKASEEEARKARDRAVRLAKELDDEQRRRQRTEIEGQMQRRASEMPGPSPEELRTARDRASQLEKELEASRKETGAAEKRLVDIGRELDESQAAEGELRRQLDVAESRTKTVASTEDGGAEYTRLETELRARAEQVSRLELQVRERDAAVRELAFSLESLQTRDAAAELQRAKERIAELSSLNTGLASEAKSLIEQNDVFRERIGHLETEVQAKSAEIETARRTPPPAAPVEDKSEQLAMAELRVREQTEAVRAAEDRAIAAERRAEESLAGLQRASKQHDEEKARAAELLRQLTDTRNELSTQYAMVVSMEDRVTQVSLELEGTRAGYVRRVRELEREVEGLVQALEVVGTHSSDEDEKVDTLMRDMDLLRAERKGMELRLRDAEASLAAQRQRVLSAPRVSEAPPPQASAFGGADAGDEMRNEQLLADLAETAARLASTEESLVATREAAITAEQRAEEFRVALEQARAEVRAAGTAGTIRPCDDDETTRREAAERELLVRSLVAQLEDRDLRLRALERRLVEEVERARRTESEIWEVELRARDQRIQSLSREMERARVEGHGGANGDTDLLALRNALEGRERELLALKTSIETVRTGLSNILVDGRGAVIAHDLVTILRQIEE